MQIIRFRRPGVEHAEIGVRDGDRVMSLDVADMATMLTRTLSEIRVLVATADDTVEGAVEVLAPVDGSTEIWASGVTYLRSREGRVEESAEASVYDRVYVADRPELFFKSVAWRVVGDGAPIGIRADSDSDLPEPELALVINRHEEIVGYTICNDVTSRAIEGENPLYLPQAKIFAGSCAIGPGVVPAWTVPDPRDLSISATVTRGVDSAWAGSTSTAELKRELGSLVHALTFADEFPNGAVLSTGTGLVPSLDFSLADGDVVEVTIARIGTLTNPVIRGKQAWLDANERTQEALT
ncbi:MAG: fumarylacetoacetate hydrolase family protein [Actinomycetia bacterium]|nr:fumarylacetoacetate hydrolase family protein [Actinomycetes bacterium]